MAGMGVTELANAVVEHYYDRWASLVFFNNSLFDFPNTPYAIEGENYPGPHGLIPVDPPVGGVSERFLILASSHSAEEFDEYDVPPTESSDAWIYAEPDIISVWEPILVSGFAADDAYGPEDLIGAIAKNGENAAKAIRDKVNNLLLGTGVKSLTGWIDDSTAAGGINRTTYAAWQSAVTDVSGVLTLEDMDDLVEEVTSGDRQANITDLEWWVPANQRTNYRRQAGIVGALARVPEQVTPGGKLDLGYTDYGHNGIPFRVIPDMATTELYLVHKPSIRIQEKRSLQIRFKDYQGDGDRMLMSWRGGLRIEEAFKCGKLENVTA